MRLSILRLGFVAVFLLLGHAGYAGGCPGDLPVTPPGTPREIDLEDLLKTPRQPSPRMERAFVTADGDLLRIRPIDRRQPGCKGEAIRTWRLWLGSNRQDAVIAVVPSAVVRTQLGGEAGLTRLIGTRIRVSGRLYFDASHRGELTRTRGTLWEIRPATAVDQCPANDSCDPAAEPAPAETPPAAPPPAEDTPPQ